MLDSSHLLQIVLEYPPKKIRYVYVLNPATVQSFDHFTPPANPTLTLPTLHLPLLL
jgi:hypothetical protein